MNVKQATFTEAERLEIEAEFRKEHPNHVYRRILALKLKAIDGKGSEESGQISGLCRTAVNKMVNRYKAGGMGVIVGKRHKGGHRYMSNEEEALFLSRFREQGEAGKVIEVTEIYRAYQEAVGHPVTRNAMYYLLAKHGWRKIMPRGKHPKKANEKAIAAYKKNGGGYSNTQKGPAETARDVPGRGWVWTDQ